MVLIILQATINPSGDAVDRTTSITVTVADDSPILVPTGTFTVGSSRNSDLEHMVM